MRGIAPPRRLDVALVAGTGLVAVLIFLLVRDSFVDDAYITLGYARNLALDLHWGLVPHEVANTVTSPLNVVLLAAATEVTRLGGRADPELAVGLVSVPLAMAMAWSWTRVVRALRLPLAAAVVGIALVLTNPFLLSAVGLEVLLIPALLVALLAAALEERAGWFGVVAGLTLLARLDLAVFVVAIAAAAPAVRRRWKRALATIVAVAGPWLVFSWLYFGSAVPDTLLIKTAHRSIWTKWGFFDGPVMYSTINVERPVAVVLGLAPAVLGLLALVAWVALRRAGPAAGLGAGGVAYYAAMSVINPGPYHWYYVPPTTALSTFLAVALGTWLVHARGRPAAGRALPALALCLAGLLALAAAARDVKHGVPWRSALISTNFALPSDYKRVGRDLRARLGDANVATYGEIGTLAFYCECKLVDEFSDHALVVPLAEDRIRAAVPGFRQLLELNYAWLDRGERPARLDYHLDYARGPARGGEVWQVWSEWNGLGHIRLIPFPKTPATARRG